MMISVRIETCPVDIWGHIPSERAVSTNTIGQNWKIQGTRQPVWSSGRKKHSILLRDGIMQVVRGRLCRASLSKIRPELSCLTQCKNPWEVLRGQVMSSYILKHQSGCIANTLERMTVKARRLVTVIIVLVSTSMLRVGGGEGWAPDKRDLELNMQGQLLFIYILLFLVFILAYLNRSKKCV